MDVERAVSRTGADLHEVSLPNVRDGTETVIRVLVCLAALFSAFRFGIWWATEPEPEHDDARISDRTLRRIHDHDHVHATTH